MQCGEKKNTYNIKLNGGIKPEHRVIPTPYVNKYNQKRKTYLHTGKRKRLERNIPHEELALPLGCEIIGDFSGLLYIILYSAHS